MSSIPGQAPTSDSIIWFTGASSTDHALVGGKGANLGNMTAKGFTVPPGFTVGTTAYIAHLMESGIREPIERILAKVDYADPVGLEKQAADIRDLIGKAPIPEKVTRDLAAAYRQIGETTFVAVRSSGTAEDLEGASFAGLHDTYLDIVGTDALVDAVKRCWASMWTGRAQAYRQNGGFDHFSSTIAVVVQEMVRSEISGVMFTGNPVNAATDQIFINTSYGLGEAIVSGIVTPDEYVVRHRDLKILDAQIGSKLVQVVRDQSKGVGTIEQEVPEAMRGRQAMTDDEIRALSDLGRQIQTAYGDFPQDIEWAYREGKFYVLQARPVTGVAFSWDADVTDSVQGNDDGCAWDELWSRTFPQEMRTGAISPLMFSWRCWGLNQCHSLGVQTYASPELDYSSRRLWIYHKFLGSGLTTATK